MTGTAGRLAGRLASRLSTLTRTGARLVTLAVVLAVAAFVLYFDVFAGDGTKSVTARFSSAVGIYQGTPVKILGVDVGQVTEVTPTPGYVRVRITYDAKYKLPAQAGAVAVANSLVSDRYIQLAPVYRSGPVMASGATIPLGHTGAPAELDDIYAALDKLSVALGPAGANKGDRNGALSTLVDVAAANLKGNGAALGTSISKLSQAAQTLADQRGDLFGTVRNLQKFTSTLKSSDGQIRLFNRQLAQVAGDLAGERTDLGSALHDLGLALDAVQGFIKDNAKDFHTDIRGLADITGVLVKQKASINETLAIAPVALANIVHAYQPDIGVIATRSNLASLANLSPGTILKQVCSTLVGLVGGTLDTLGKGILDGLGSGATGAQSVCTALGKTAGGLPPIPTLPGLGGLVGG